MLCCAYLMRTARQTAHVRRWLSGLHTIYRTRTATARERVVHFASCWLRCEIDTRINMRARVISNTNRCRRSRYHRRSSGAEFRMGFRTHIHTDRRGIRGPSPHHNFGNVPLATCVCVVRTRVRRQQRRRHSTKKRVRIETPKIGLFVFGCAHMHT